MNANASTNSTNGKSNTTTAILKRLLQLVVQFLIQAALLFIPAGRLDWVWAWVYLGLGVADVVINVLVILPSDPELIAERAQTKEDTKDWDKKLNALAGLVFLLMLVIAGLDVRFGWSPQMPLAIYLVALTVGALGYGLFSWAMASNRFFSRVVRVQMDRDHTVATGGPYRYVRHPGYAGFTLHTLATPLMLGSLWAFIPVACVVIAIIVRTALEDRTLQEELDGYKDYARRVRYRLLPGVW